MSWGRYAKARARRNKKAPIKFFGTNWLVRIVSKVPFGPIPAPFVPARTELREGTLPAPLISFDDQELAALRTAAAALPPQQRDRFLKTLARALGCRVAIGPRTVAQIAVAVQQSMSGFRKPVATTPRRQQPTLATADSGQIDT
jgi:hypothetical protein